MTWAISGFAKPSLLPVAKQCTKGLPRVRTDLPGVLHNQGFGYALSFHSGKPLAAGPVKEALNVWSKGNQPKMSLPGFAESLKQ